ncbi:hypothetical protein [Sporosarcina sp. ITBMC105]
MPENQKGGIRVIKNISGYWLFPSSLMIGLSMDEEQLDIFLGVFAFSIEFR